MQKAPFAQPQCYIDDGEVMVMGNTKPFLTGA